MDVIQTIESFTGCVSPCTYTEYRLEKPPIKYNREEEGIGFLLWLTSPYILVETEEELYDMKSLVADVGGTFGLFLGFSLIGMWDIFESIIEKATKNIHFK